MKERIRFNHYKRCWGDRGDGWRLRGIDPFSRMIPYFLRTRMDSQVFYETTIQIEHIESFIRKHRETMPELSIMHVIMAALVRLFSQRPHLNRFVIWNKLFARNYLSIALAVKRSMSDDGEETIIKPYFQLTDTLSDVVKKISTEQKANQPVGEQNAQDNIAKLLNYLPDFLLRFAVFVLRWLDRVGLLPKALNKISPWHSSMFITNIGSLGIESIYHHLYEFGTCSMFVAMGKKSRQTEICKDGQTKNSKTILLKFVLDERVCDGFYYASSMRLFDKILANPEQLLLPPEKVVVDEAVGAKRADV